MSEPNSSGQHFSIIPHWVIFSGASSGAIHLYAVLAKYADWDTGEAFPSRSTLAKGIGKSADTVDRHVKELKDIGAVTVETRHRKGTKENRSNKYTLVGSRTVAATLGAKVRPGSRMDAVENNNHLTKTTPNNNHHIPTSEQSSDEIHFTSKTSFDSRDDHLPKGAYVFLRQKLQNVGESIQRTGSFYDEDTQWLWEESEAHLEEATEHLPYGDMIVDLTQNGKWTVNATVADEYEAGKELTTLLNTARAC